MIALTSALLVSSTALATVQHTFRYVATPGLKSVSVAGEFNSWNNTQHPLKLGADGRTWTATVPLTPGAYQYKFVEDGTRWILDPSNPKKKPDGQGNTNSYLVILPDDFAVNPASDSDGVVTRSVLAHRNVAPDLNYDRGRLTLRMSHRPGDVRSVNLLVNGRSVAPLKLLTENEVVATMSASIPWDRKTPLRYAFEIRDGQRTLTFGPLGLTSADSRNAFELEPKNFSPIEVPKWVERTVFYQIFPDRFRNGSKTNDPETKTPWNGAPTWWNRFGGDAVGVEKSLPYLQALGVNGMYLNPVMAAPSNHRYDPVDFYRIDPEFGTTSEFVKMTETLDNGGVKVVLDQIFDHVGITFAPFADVLKYQEKSRYRNWFFIKEYPVTVRQNPPYEAWYGYESMPKVNLMNPEVQDYLLESVDYWMSRAKLSGWRLDVANEVPHEFWRIFRPYVKQRNPDAWIVGEVWSDARVWLQGDQWDASMNYPFRNAVLGYVAKGTKKPSHFMSMLMDVYNWYVPQISRNQLNLLSSHDTSRFITEAGDNPLLAALGATVQFTWPGAPSVYYGEEIGMTGGNDPANRAAMQWDRVRADNRLLRHYQLLSRLRTQSETLASGEPVVLTQFDDANVATFGRQAANDFVTVALNRSTRPFEGVIQLPRSEASKSFLCAISGRTFSADGQAQLRIKLDPLSSLVAFRATPTNVRLVETARAVLTTPLPETQS